MKTRLSWSAAMMVAAFSQLANAAESPKPFSSDSVAPAQTQTAPKDGVEVPDVSEKEAHMKDVIANTKFVYFGDSNASAPSLDDTEKLLEQFYMNQYRQFHDPESPYFMFMAKDASISMGVGGKLMLRGWFDWNGSQDSFDFIPYDISVPRDPTQRYMLGGTPRGTSLFVTVLGNHAGMNYMVYVQLGAKKNWIGLSKAYITLNDFTLGYAGTTFADGDALVPTVDDQGPNGKVDKTQLLGRYFHTFKSGWSVGGGVEFPGSDKDVVDGETASCRDYIPDIVGLVQYGWGGGDSHIRASGLLRTMTYRDLLKEKNHNVVGWGAQLSGVVNIVKPLMLYFSGVIGKGVGSYTGDLSEGSYDLVGVSNHPGKMVAPLSFSATAGVQYNFTSDIFACVGFGEVRYLEKHHIKSDEYKYGLYGTANLFWRITPRITTGIEYITGKRMNYDGSHAGANRVDAMFSLSF